jgi:hypothetical protein
MHEMPEEMLVDLHVKWSLKLFHWDIGTAAFCHVPGAVVLTIICSPVDADVVKINGHVFCSQDSLFLV